MKIKSSLTEKIDFQGREFFIKRDDLLDKNFSGNKARKFQYFLEFDFPHINKVISHGSNQSNAMYSLSVLAKMKNWDFEYYVDHIPSFLKENPQGNYKYALENGMKIFESDIPTSFDSDTLFISEGGAITEAQYGIKVLADEIIQWAIEQKIEDLNIFLPSGTGTTALFLQKFLPFKVFTCACVGDEKYLQYQFEQLESQKFPIILSAPKKYHFGKLYKENYYIWKELFDKTGIEFDLLYDPVGWNTLLQSNLIQQKTKLLYVHQGGIIGNETMIRRYCRKIEKK